MNEHAYLLVTCSPNELAAVLMKLGGLNVMPSCSLSDLRTFATDDESDVTAHQDTPDDSPAVEPRQSLSDALLRAAIDCRRFTTQLA
ncbi:MAG: hypothetical protein KDB23_28380 [Planctomycetales bacterium]|nr:hypothetical protein [Planctomycetales bacterium]